MRIVGNNLENVTHGRLYCIWVPAVEGRPTPLVARWIDSEANKDDQRSRQNSSGERGEDAMLWYQFASRLIAAFVLGGLVGVERQ
jgi:hypothetical protein